jgi:hypothetical protein
MKLPASLLFAIALTATVSTAEAAEQCRFIEARAEREACYQRQEAARVARQKAQEAQQAAQPKPYEPMTSEDAQLARSLRSICRGC